jgi:hypothetical protein
MAAPNVVNTSTITGKSVHYTATTSLADTGVTNTSGSNKVFKINSIILANKGAATVPVRVAIVSSSTTYYLAYDIPVPLGATLVLIGKDDATFYLEENEKIQAYAASSTSIDVHISYEEIS